MNWRTVDICEVYEIHQAIIKRSGTKASIRDFTLLHSAVERPEATFQGRDLYPTVFLKAAALLESLCLNHAFTDGNKRTAWLAAKRLLELNGYHLRAGAKEGADFMVYIDNQKPSLVLIYRWLKKHSQETG